MYEVPHAMCTVITTVVMVTMLHNFHPYAMTIGLLENCSTRMMEKSRVELKKNICIQKSNNTAYKN